MFYSPFLSIENEPLLWRASHDAVNEPRYAHLPHRIDLGWKNAHISLFFYKGTNRHYGGFRSIRRPSDTYP